MFRTITVATLAILTLTSAVSAASPIRVGQTIEGNLAEGDTTGAQGAFLDEFTFEASEGQTFTVHSHSDEFDGILSVTDSAGASDTNDDFESTRDSEVTFEVTESGPVTISMTSFLPGAGGSYILTLQTGGDVAAGLRGSAQDDALPISIGQTVQGMFEPGDNRLMTGEWSDVFVIYGQAGTPVTIDVTSDQFDTYLIVALPDGEQIENDDAQPGVNLNAQLSFTMPQTGEYMIIPTTFAPGTVGPYEISLQSGLVAAVPTTAPSIGPGTSTLSIGQTDNGQLVQGDSTLTSGEWMDVYNFQGTAGQPVQIALSSNVIDTYLILVHPDGQQEENDDSMGSTNSRLDLNLTQTGTHQIVATTYRVGETGPYTISVNGGATQPSTPPSAPVAYPPTVVTPPVTPPTNVSSGPTFQGSLDANDARLDNGEFIDRYTFEGQAGQAVEITMESNAIDTYLIVWNPTQGQRDNDDATQGQTTLSRLEMTLPETGTYTIGATSYAPAETGPYTVAVNFQSGPGTVAGDRDYYGIFCGISDYAPLGMGGPDLALCNSDAVKLAQSFTTLGFMEQDNCILLTDADATTANIRGAFQTLAPRIDENDVFVFFFSGHGGKTAAPPDSGEADEENEYLVPFEGSQLMDDEMEEMFDLINADIALICLDACFSGGFAKDVIVQPHRLGLFSSEEDLTSSVAGKFEAGGYLSHFFHQAVTGLADNDPSNGLLTVGELCHYLQVEFARNVIEEISAESMLSEQGYQHLVVDRGGVKLEDVFLNALSR